MAAGWYYLHENGDLIHKNYLDPGQAADFRDSDFVKMFWFIDTDDRETVWRLLVESLSIGAKKERVMELAAKWACTDKDAEVYADRVGIDLDVDGNMKCARPPKFTNLQECHAGFGATNLEAMADLCKRLGFRAQKTWGTTFQRLIDECRHGN